LDAYAIDVLADVHFPVVSGDDDAPAEQRFRVAERVVGEKNISRSDPASIGVIVAPLGHTVRLYREIDSRVANVNDLQVRNAPSGRQHSSPNLSVRDSLRAIGHDVWDERPQPHSIATSQESLNCDEPIFEVSGVQPSQGIVNDRFSKG
jgi:hypothetical protein